MNKGFLSKEGECPMNNSLKEKKSVLDWIEYGGNKLPHPVTIFLIFTLLVVIISHIAYLFGVNVTYAGMNPDTGKREELTVEVMSLLTTDGIRFIFTGVVEHFTTFVALGPVLVAMLGVGVAEKSGYISALMTNVVTKAPKKFVTPIVVFMGVMSNIAASVGYVVLVPLGAIIFLGFRRHPLAGLAAAFAGVAGGYSANLLIGTNDPLLAGITTEAAAILDTTYIVDATDNWYFMLASTFLIVILGTLITDKVIEPRLGKYDFSKSDIQPDEEINKVEKRALRWSNISAIITVLLVLALVAFPSSPLRGDDGGIIGSPFISSIIFIMMLVFLVPGLVYGVMTKEIKNDKDAVKLMDSSIETMAGFIVLIFFAAQFVALFTYSNLGTVIAVNGANLLEKLDIGVVPILVIFILLSALIDIVIAADSAKWAIMAPIFVPMFMQLGISPEVSQAAYRIGDSTTNVVSPLMPFFPLIVAFSQRYGRENGIGTVVSLMLPYSIIFLISWTILFVIWYLFGIPFGPGASNTY